MLEIKTAVISVSDKTNIVEFAKFMDKCGVKIISTGGTGKILKDNKIEIIPISHITGNTKDDYFDGRMKTISFNFESALLFKRDNSEHLKQAEELGIPTIDMVVCNLYPFEAVTKNLNISVEDAIENIDIGGPCMIRAAAKNYTSIAVVVNPARYANIMEEMEKNNCKISLETRKKLMTEAFERTADYDAAIHTFFSKVFNDEKIKRLKYVKGLQLGRYAENWHQKGWFYKSAIPSPEPTVTFAKQIHGSALGYNNIIDAESALRLAVESQDKICVSIIKHSNPCGFATGDSLLEALERAWEGDKVSAFGSVIGMNRNLDLDTAKILGDRFIELVIAPKIEDDALNFIKNLGNKKEDLRLLEYLQQGEETTLSDRHGVLSLLPDNRNVDITCCRNNYDGCTNLYENELRFVRGGLVEQERDDKYYLTNTAAELFTEARNMKCQNSGKNLLVGIVTKNKPPAAMAGLCDFALKHLKYVKSNAINIAREYESGKYQVIGMGCGQPNRKDSVELAGRKTSENLGDEFLKKILYTDNDRQSIESLYVYIKSLYVHINRGDIKRIFSALNMLQEETPQICTRDQYLKILRKENETNLVLKYLDMERIYITRKMNNTSILMASDAFFPFKDGIDNAAKTGIKYIVQPGGSVRDNEVIDAANNYGIGMIFTGIRKFYH